jgi:hypothetical protein
MCPSAAALQDLLRRVGRPGAEAIAAGDVRRILGRSPT